jgi:hypothetical protein
MSAGMEEFDEPTGAPARGSMFLFRSSMSFASSVYGVPARQNVPISACTEVSSGLFRQSGGQPPRSRPKNRPECTTTPASLTAATATALFAGEIG